ncbi:MarR family winged helix-turn-helix transcriptional regulator [Plantactinospora siamensis]|uniref:MarR family winged helix-turn-helix transcriptional regulator n=1 Tax=Plantactinospora siamensis TaxID=555372 RepID=A0ABV6NWF8_9ACTN
MSDEELPGQLRLAVGRLSRRLRQMVAAQQDHDGISFIETAVLTRLERDGPSSPGALAGSERVTSQAIAGVVTQLEGRGLVRRSPDPTDGRRVIVAITDTGRSALNDRQELIVRRLQTALSTEFTPAERKRLAAAVPLLERLAGSL